MNEKTRLDLERLCALYQLMANENDPGITLEETAKRAQQIYLELRSSQ